MGRGGRRLPLRLRWWQVPLLIWFLLVLIGFVKFYAATGCIPLGRLALVKLHDPDIRPGGLHELIAVNTAIHVGKPAVVVVHNAGNEYAYGAWLERGVLVWNIACLDPRGNKAPIDWWGVLRELLFADRLKHAMWVHDGPVPGPVFPRDAVMFWHGTIRQGFPLIYGGCGCEPYYYILANYGNVPFAITAVVLGWFTPFILSPLEAFRELIHYRYFQYLYVTKAHGVRLINTVNLEGSASELEQEVPAIPVSSTPSLVGPPPGTGAVSSAPTGYRTYGGGYGD